MEQNIPNPQRRIKTASEALTSTSESSRPSSSRPSGSRHQPSSSHPRRPPPPPPRFIDDDAIDIKRNTKAMVMAPASKPGAMTISGLDADATVQAVESDLMIKQRARVPANKPGAEGAAVAMEMESDATFKKQVAASQSSDDAMLRKVKKHDPEKGPIVPASRPGVVATSDLVGAQAKHEVAAVQSQDPDLRVKQRVWRPPGSRPDAARGLTMKDSSAGVQTVDSDIAIKQRVAREQLAEVQANRQSKTLDLDIAVKQRVNRDRSSTNVESDLAIKQRVVRAQTSSQSRGDYFSELRTLDLDIRTKQRVDRERASAVQARSLASADAEAIVASHDADLASKQNLNGSSEPKPLQDLRRPPTIAREQIEATMQRMEMEDATPPENSASTVGPMFVTSSLTNTFFVRDDRDQECESNTRRNILEVGSTHLSMAGSVQTRQGDFNDVVEATQIDEDAELEKLPGAEVFNPNQGHRHFYKRPRFIAVVLCLVCVCMAAVVAISVVVVSINKDSEDYVPDEELVVAPSGSPTLEPTSSDEQFLRVFLASINISQATLDQTPVAYEMAVNWYANEDPGRNKSIDGSEYPWDLTRFVMAWFYYATSSNGTRPWVSCNPPDYSRGESDTCTWLKFSDSAWDQSVDYTQVTDTPRWLSRFDVTSWAGLSSNGLTEGEYAGACNHQMGHIELRDFGLSGPLPYMLNLLPCMYQLRIGFEPHLRGSLDDELFNFPSEATYSVFSFFQLTSTPGVSGTIPDIIWHLPNLKNLLIKNTNISGSLPDLIYSDGQCPYLMRLQIAGNPLDDAILPVISACPELYLIDFSRSGFTGQIPSDYGNLPALQELWLQENHLTGPIPDSFLNSTQMELFNVGQNQLNGTVPGVMWSSAYVIDLWKNQFEGPLPANLAKMTNLTEFYCDENNFNGTLDPAIGDNLLSLKRFVIGKNTFSGTIPASLANITTLNVLSLESNNFEGNISFEICRLRSDYGLSALSADCLGYPPKIYCGCCTACCNSRTSSCESREDI